MKNMTLLILSILICSASRGQATQDLPKQMFSVNLGAGKHGTGDIYGIMGGFEYEKQFLPRLSWSTEFGMTIHDGEDVLLVKVDNLPQEDMSYRFTTAGMQLGGKVGFHAVRTKIADLGVKLGTALRYQSTSLADESEILFPALTGYPIPLRVLRNTEQQRTLAATAILQLFARFTWRKNIVTGATLGSQMDTNGDVIIPQISLTIGKRF